MHSSGVNAISDSVSAMRVAVLVFDGVFDSGLAAILDVLATANSTGEEAATMGIELPDAPSWTVTTVGQQRQVRTGAGHIVTAQPFEVADTADLLIVPALAEKRPAALLEQVTGDHTLPGRASIVRQHARGAAIATACTGTLLLAETGILDGHDVTTSWWLAPTLRATYPSVRVDQNRMLITSGLITTAGAAFAHVDLALSIVRDRSPMVADLIARYLVIDDRPSQSAYIIPSALAQNDPVVAAFERWTREHLAEPISIPAAAGAIGVSERTLQRSVQRTVGTSPIRFVQDLRIERATHLLRTTDLSIETIARRVGYEQPNTLRVLLRDRTGRTTNALRRT
jgi:transcriptional regulator GlxA family with amidase domain